MSEIEILNIELKDIKNAIDEINKAMNDISDINGLDEEYKQLEIIWNTFDNKRLDIERELENLEEEAFYKENDLIWKKEKEQELKEYWNTQF